MQCNPATQGELFEKLYRKSLEGDADCDGLLAHGYYSGENITMINEGRLEFLRTADSKLNLANFMKVNLYTSLGAVKMGLDILMKDEKVKVDRITGHGGFFKKKGVGKLIWAYVTYCLLCTAYTVVNIPLNTIVPRLTSGIHERDVLVSTRMICAMIGTASVVCLLIGLVITGLGIYGIFGITFSMQPSPRSTNWIR